MAQKDLKDKLVGLRVTYDMYNDMAKRAGGSKMIPNYVRKLVERDLKLDGQFNYSDTTEDLSIHAQRSDSSRPRRVSGLSLDG